MQAIDIWHFVVTDRVKKGQSEIAHCPTDNVIGDCFTKLLQGAKFSEFRKINVGKG